GRNSAQFLDPVTDFHGIPCGLVRRQKKTRPGKTGVVFPGRVTLSSCSGSRTHQLIDSFRISRRLDAIKSSWQTLNRNVAALEDRGHVFCFEPSPLEVHRRTATWFWDQEIFDFLGRRCRGLGKPRGGIIWLPGRLSASWPCPRPWWSKS